MSGLSHLFERQGLSTVLIGLIPQHVQAIRPPRALLVPFDLGRPLGAPGDPELQQQVLRAALNLLDAPGPGPITDQLSATVVPATQPSEVWSCPVSFPSQPDSSLTGRVNQEISLLMPWFEKASAQRQHTATGVSGLSIEAAASWLCSLLDTDEFDSPVPETPLALTFKLAVEDLKAFYLEAATAQPGGSAQDLAHWLWQQTALADLLMALRDRFKAYEADPQLRIYALATAVPESEVQRRKQLAANG